MLFYMRLPVSEFVCNCFATETSIQFIKKYAYVTVSPDRMGDLEFVGRPMTYSNNMGDSVQIEWIIKIEIESYTKIITNKMTISADLWIWIQLVWI